ncbi:amidohydrolase family protein [Pigmentiphaga soli]|uniref:Amidohydrolase family protein n=1 Tax=Pigmentiphaga soli TaxID=1007095 RepID=A0ABP8GV06_9BURK
MVHVAKPPDPNPVAPRLKCPAGAVDAHLHLFGPAERYPFVPETQYLSGDALPESCIAMHDVLGIAHGVIVSGGAYGRDPAHLLDVLARFPGRFRGVCVPADDLGHEQIAHMDALGVRGVRFVSDARGAHLPRILPDLAARVAEHGWHVQFYAQGTDIVDHAERLRRLPNQIVIDHFGSMPAELGVDQPAFRAVLDLLDTGRVWVKLSGPMYCSRQEFPYADIVPFAHALVRHAPERLVWGSDWPHLHMKERSMPNDGHLLDLLLDWVPDAATRDAILAANPARLYGF